ncbi:Hypothetical protein, putative [Bodo saltans]|uniref:Uncharacterized protein n=1 Tax=Bodo saltans TaxID=75058 RepID=A0A0S4JQG2_BODSA|nr:Hypothetical protein, putative [Bodo saltans]|eukprot:CUG92494.1 Hypothetical protein, putative [Bodo saltans]
MALEETASRTTTEMVPIVFLSMTRNAPDSFQKLRCQLILAKL